MKPASKARTPSHKDDDADNGANFQRALRKGRVVAHRGNGRNASGTPGGEPRREHRDDDAHHICGDDRARLKHEAAARNLQPDGPEEALNADRHCDTEPKPKVAPKRPTTNASAIKRDDNLDSAGAERPEERELSGALGDQHREGVENQEDADEQRDEGKDQQEDVDEA